MLMRIRRCSGKHLRRSSSACEILDGAPAAKAGTEPSVVATAPVTEAAAAMEATTEAVGLLEAEADDRACRRHFPLAFKPGGDRGGSPQLHRRGL